MTKDVLFLVLVFLATAGLTPSVFRPELPPVVAISCAKQGVPPCCGNHLKFNAMVGNVDPSDKISYRWSLTKGAILMGQGTSSIEVDASDAKEQPIIVTLEVRVREARRKRRSMAAASYQTCKFPAPPNQRLQRTGISVSLVDNLQPAQLSPGR
jgi:hypothetical protein